jgi:hypothetical protein
MATLKEKKDRKIRWVEVKSKLESGDLIPGYMFSYANIKTDKGEVRHGIIQTLEEHPDVAVPTYELYNKIKMNGLHGPACKDFDESLFESINLLRHGEGEHPTVASVINGKTHENVVRSVLQTLDMDVLDGSKYVYDIGCWHNEMEWDVVCLSKSQPVVLFVEAKVQAGGGSLDIKWVVAAFNNMAANRRRKTFKFI